MSLISFIHTKFHSSSKPIKWEVKAVPNNGGFVVSNGKYFVDDTLNTWGSAVSKQQFCLLQDEVLAKELCDRANFFGA